MSTPDGAGFVRPTTASRPVLVCIVAITCMTLIALVGMLTRTLPGDDLIVILALIAGTGGWGAGAHFAAAERVRANNITDLFAQYAARTKRPDAPAET